jgi:Bacterial dnaA protein helix-turn-helix
MTTPLQLAAAEARKARLLRFEQAAARHQAAKSPPAVVTEPKPVIEAEPHSVPAAVAAPCQTAEAQPEPHPPAAKARRSRKAAPCQTRPRRPANVTGPIWHRVLNVVSSECGVSVAAILGRRRIGKIVFARHVVVGLLCELTDYSLPKIGRRLGNRDHTTILNNRNRARELFASEAFRNRVDQLKAEIMS